MLLRTQPLLGILLLCIINSQGQIPFDPGKVKADSQFNCELSSMIMWDSAIRTIGKICNSKNKLEIRLTCYSLPKGGEDIILLTFNNGLWDAKKYRHRRGSLGEILEFSTFQHTPDTDKINGQFFNIIFDTLKNNNIFLLPDQNELTLEGDAHDGAAYVLSFKVDNNYRTYRFRNVETFISMHPGVRELKQYAQIVYYLQSLFD